MDKTTEGTNFLGIDGCKGGWIALSADRGFSRLSLHKVNHLKDLRPILTKAHCSLIDMPIGLPSKQAPKRECDSLARTLLKKRRSSVFSPPTAEAVAGTDYQTALKANRQAIGVGISKQVYNISGKIREVRAFLEREKSIQSTLFESHPELVFTVRNEGHPLVHSKATPAGVSERLAILRRRSKRLDQFLKNELEALSPFAKRDDLLDAAALLTIAVEARSPHGLCFLGLEQSRELSCATSSIPTKGYVIAYSAKSQKLGSDIVGLAG